jgi:hypothetical protein
MSKVNAAYQWLLDVSCIALLAFIVLSIVAAALPGW